MLGLAHGSNSVFSTYFIYAFDFKKEHEPV